MTHRRLPREALAATVTLVTVLLCLLATPATAATAAGPVEIINPATSYPLNSGGSSTAFGLTVPPGARCPGDSAHDGYHVFTYAVRAGTDPGSVGWYLLLPTKGVPLISYALGPYEAKNTAIGTGEIPQLPNDFEWQRFSPRQLLGAASHAVWTAVIACAATPTTITTYWTAQVQFDASSTDPRGFVWAVTKPLHRAQPVEGLGVRADRVRSRRRRGVVDDRSLEQPTAPV